MQPRILLVICLFIVLASAPPAGASACVWKVTKPGGGTLYLGGSVHALRKSDYPLAAEYDRAFDASSRLAFETDLNAMRQQHTAKDSEYARGDSLKNHVDPRTYDYLRRFFAVLHVPEANFAKYRPWFIVESLTSPSMQGMSTDLGVESYLMKKARAANKPTVGLTPLNQHMAVLSGLTDKQAEILLLSTFIPDEQGHDHAVEIMHAWRRGDADSLARTMHASLARLPSYEERLIGARNRAWIPTIEEFYRSGKTYFVVVGSGHLGGSNGVLALLRNQGYQLEQL